MLFLARLLGAEISDQWSVVSDQNETMEQYKLEFGKFADWAWANKPH